MNNRKINILMRVIQNKMNINNKILIKQIIVIEISISKECKTDTSNKQMK